MHIAIIMDGNRRWAKSKNMPVIFGHRQGVKALKEIIKHSINLKIKYLTVYAFSTENWNRQEEEVSLLLNLMAEVIENEFKDLKENNVKVKIIGDYKKFPKTLNEKIQKLEEETKNSSGLNLQVALNYGSRDEILNAVVNISSLLQEGKLTPNDISEENFSKFLYTKNIPDPDLLIRTGGDQRISNYLLWQCAYSELYFTEVLWPDFAPSDLNNAIDDYVKRQRRFGR